ncbi:MAG: sigma-54 interaction domain-containing protein, partial [Gemmatimonadales bacterium]
GLIGELVGDSPSMHELRAMIQRVAPSDARVMITGESGTGKELVAAAIHAQSPRRDRPFVRVNCAAIPRDLVESEMFGHERGAFTGATDRRLGRFELAHTGTLLLDEVGDLGAEAQAKLLRAIESKEIERVGGRRPIKVDVRILAATNHDLERAVREGQFRDDLYFRLNVIPVAVSPLRERPGDIPALVRHFAALLRRRSGQAAPVWTDDAIRALATHRWPGNVRELANIVERLSILHAGRAIGPAEVAEVLPMGDGVSAPPLPDPVQAELTLGDTLDDYERLLIERAISAANGVVAEAARRLRTDRPNLYRRMKRLGIVSPGE